MLSPEQQAADYRAQGYDFLALTDHNIMKTHVQFNSDDFLMIPGWERDIPYGTTKCLHVVGLFPSDTPDGSVITRPRGNPDVMSQQQLIDQMRSENVFVEIAHPIWSRSRKNYARFKDSTPSKFLTPALNVFVMQAMPRSIGICSCAKDGM